MSFCRTLPSGTVWRRDINPSRGRPLLPHGSTCISSPIYSYRVLLTPASRDRVIRSPRLAAMGVATLSGLIPTFLEPMITPIITRPWGRGGDTDRNRWEMSECKRRETENRTMEKSHEIMECAVGERFQRGYKMTRSWRKLFGWNVLCFMGQ